MSTVRTDEKRLIDECLAGRSSSFEELVRRYQDRLFNTVYRLLDNAEDARDVVQETFLNAYQSLARFKGDAQFYTWLYRIAVNNAMSLKRKQQVASRTLAGAAGIDTVELPDESEASKPGQFLERAEQEQQIQQALMKLSSEHRLVLILKDMEGKKYESIAEIMQVPIGTIRSRLHRARMELRGILTATPH